MELQIHPIISIFWKKDQGEPLLPKEEALLQEWQDSHPSKDMWENIEEELMLYGKFELEKHEVIVQFKEAFRKEFLTSASDEVVIETEEVHVPPTEGIVIERRGLSFRAKMGIAATIVILSIAGVLYLLPKSVTKQVVVFPTAVDTGMSHNEKQVAIILSDGSRITVGAQKDGLIKTQGDIDILQDNGTLVYKRIAGRKPSPLDSFNIVQVPRGKQLTVKLPEGTTVALNAESSIKFSLPVEQGTRNVTLLGEGTFQVAHDSHRPFYVHAKGISVEAIGTQFIVQAYKEQKKVKIIHLDGKIMIGNGKALQPVQSPMIYEADGDTIKFLTRNPEAILEATARGRGMFYYSESTLSEIIPEIERWYNLELADKKALSINYHFRIDSMSRSNPVDSIITALEGSREIRVTVAGKKLFIRKK